MGDEFLSAEHVLLALLADERCGRAITDREIDGPISLGTPRRRLRAALSATRPPIPGPTRRQAVMQKAALTEEALRNAVESVRGGRRVTSRNPEAAYEARRPMTIWPWAMRP